MLSQLFTYTDLMPVCAYFFGRLCRCHALAGINAVLHQCTDRVQTGWTVCVWTRIMYELPLTQSARYYRVHSLHNGYILCVEACCCRGVRGLALSGGPPHFRTRSYLLCVATRLGQQQTACMHTHFHILWLPIVNGESVWVSRA
jgi:hypothetical protein